MISTPSFSNPVNLRIKVGNRAPLRLGRSEPWFVGKDVAEVLELGNPRSTLALLDEDEKGVHTVDTLGGNQRVTVINEPALYALILKSRKPEAKAFKKWVTGTVLPAIRKTGGYIQGEEENFGFEDELIVNQCLIISPEPLDWMTAIIFQLKVRGGLSSRLPTLI